MVKYGQEVLKMKASKCLKALFILTLLSLCLPWFTYNAKVMGYRYGFAFLKWFAVPIAIETLCLFWPRRNAVLIVLGELAHAANFAALALALGLWQQVCNIKSGIHWQEGFHTAQPGFWVSACFFILFFLNFQIDLMKGKQEASGK